MLLSHGSSFSFSSVLHGASHHFVLIDVGACQCVCVCVQRWVDHRKKEVGEKHNKKETLHESYFSMPRSSKPALSANTTSHQVNYHTLKTHKQTQAVSTRDRDYGNQKSEMRLFQNLTSLIWRVAEPEKSLEHRTTCFYPTALKCFCLMPAFSLYVCFWLLQK